MGTMDERPLLMKLAVPMMISMLIQALYNVVDSFFVSRLSEDALTAVGLAFPVQNLMIGIAVGTGVGINSLLSRRLGEKKQKAVNDTAMNGIFLALLSTIAFIFVGFFGAHAFFERQTENPEIVKMGTDYLRICCVVSFGMFFDIAYARLLQSTGKTKLSMIGQMVGAITNIILDPIMIFGLLGCPKMGVAGAAVATVIGQILSSFVDLYFNLKYNKEIQFKLRGWRPSGKTIGEIYAVGVPAIVNTTVVSVMIYGINLILITFSASATAVMTVYFKLQSFIYMPVFGLNNGMIPIVAYNFGARRPDRIRRTTKIALIYAFVIMAIGLALFQLFPKPILSIFIDKPETMAMGVAALRRISLGFLFSGVVFVLCSVFQALARGVYALIVQIVRQLVGVLPIAWLLAKTGEVNNVWWAFPCAEVLGFIVALLLYRRVKRTQLDKL